MRERLVVLVLVVAAVIVVVSTLALRSEFVAPAADAREPIGVTVYGEQVPGLIETYLVMQDPDALESPNRRELIDAIALAVREPATVDEQDDDISSIYTPQIGDETSRQRGIAVLQEMEERGIFEMLDELTTVRRAVREPQDGAMIGWIVGELGAMRRATRACAARMYLAREAGDHAAAARAFEHMMAIGRVATHDVPMISHLVGMAVTELALGQLQQYVARWNPDASSLKAFMAAKERQRHRMPLVLALEGERLVGLDIVRGIYEDPDYTPEQVLVSLLQEEGARMPSRRMARSMVRQRMGGMLTREEADQTVEEGHVKAMAAARVPHHDVVAASEALNDYIEDLPPSHRIARWTTSGVPPALEADVMLHTRIAGMRLLLALESFAASEGRYPDSLEALVPAYLEALPKDPYTGDAFRYRVMVKGADEHGRGYLLYSVGRDGTDNGGRIHEDGVLAAGQKRGAGFDFVINEPLAEGGER